MYKQLMAPAVEIGAWIDPKAPMLKDGHKSMYVPVVALALTDEGEVVPLVIDEGLGEVVPAWHYSLIEQTDLWTFVCICYKADFDMFTSDDWDEDEYVGDKKDVKVGTA